MGSGSATVCYLSIAISFPLGVWVILMNRFWLRPASLEHFFRSVGWEAVISAGQWFFLWFLPHLQAFRYLSLTVTSSFSYSEFMAEKLLLKTNFEGPMLLNFLVADLPWLSPSWLCPTYPCLSQHFRNILASVTLYRVVLKALTVLIDELCLEALSLISLPYLFIFLIFSC